MKIIILSDLHLTVAGHQIIGIDPLARLDQALAHAQRMHRDAAHFVLLGDLSHRGQIPAYRALHGRLAALDKPVSIMLGNHDDRANFRSVFPDAPDAQGFVQSLLDTETDRLIFLDSLHSETEPFHAGYLCQTRLNWLAAALDGAEGRRVSIFMHHPPFEVGFPGMDRIALANPADFWKVAKGRVAHLFLGHVHRTISGTIHETGFTIFKSPAHQMPMDMAGLSSSLSVAEPGAYGIALFQPEAIIVHSDDFTLAMEIGSDKDSE
jgi:Icc protein